jgi:hypothetical protein
MKRVEIRTVDSVQNINYNITQKSTNANYYTTTTQSPATYNASVVKKTYDFIDIEL